MKGPTLLTLLSASVALSYDADTASPQGNNYSHYFVAFLPMHARIDRYYSRMLR